MNIEKIIKENKGKSFGIKKNGEVVYFDYNATDVHCHNNNLTHLELPNATYVYCYNNNLTHLELPNATYVHCHNNNLTHLEAENILILYSDILKLNNEENVIGIDGFISKIVSTKKKGDFTIHIDSNGIFIVQKGKFNSHGKDLKTAIDDCNFKFIQENFTDEEKSKIVKKIKENNVVTKNDYRLLTGACSEGVEMFKKDNAIDSDHINLYDLKKIIGNSYGSSEFLELLEN